MSGHVQWEDVQAKAKKLSFRVEGDNDKSWIAASTQMKSSNCI